MAFQMCASEEQNLDLFIMTEVHAPSAHATFKRGNETFAGQVMVSSGTMRLKANAMASLGNT
jgi:hypothetical protein